MAESIESIIKHSQPSLGEELRQSIMDYPATFKAYFKQLAPAIAISSIGSALGQWGMTELGYDSKFATTAAAYVCGYVPGYSYFFASEYRNNRNKYPGVFSKEFGEFVGTFMAADYVADITTFTPAFIASNLWLTDNTNLHPAVRSLVAWNTSAMLYISAMAGLHPVARKINQAINNSIKTAYRKLRGNSSSNTPCAL